jgi:hypothetical protein
VLAKKSEKVSLEGSLLKSSEYRGCYQTSRLGSHLLDNNEARQEQLVRTNSGEICVIY